MNLGQWVAKRAELAPDALLVKSEGVVLNNGDFDRLVERTAGALQRLGAAKGDRVAVVLDNSIAFLQVLFACARIGAVFTPLNPQWSAAELAEALGDCRPRVVLAARNAPPASAAVDQAGDAATRFFALNGEDGFLAAVDQAAPTQVPLDLVEADDPVLLMYMPAPEGGARAIVVSHENLLFDAIHSVLGFGMNAEFKSLVVAPMHHIGSLTASVIAVVYAGGSLVLDAFYSPSHILSVIAEEKINYMFAVPVMYQMLAKAPEWPQADFSHVRYFISGGAPLPPPVIEAYHQEKGIRFPQGYGMTETGRLTALSLADSRRKAGSVGKPVFHVLLKLVDAEGRVVEDGEVGEIVVKGPNVFRGYLNRPEQTAAVLKNGWFFTGDLARRDEEGFLYLIGRKTDLIIVSGRNIFPAEVERALTGLPGVKAAAVVGRPDPAKGQVLAAAVEVEGALVDAEELRQALAERLAAYKIPRKIKVVDALPRTPAGSPDREAVQALFD
jgi:fatty-acyl-CoA synthase